MDQYPCERLCRGSPLFYDDFNQGGPFLIIGHQPVGYSFQSLDYAFGNTGFSKYFLIF